MHRHIHSVNGIQTPIRTGVQQKEKKITLKNGGSAEHTMQIGLLNDIKGIKAIN